MNIPKKIICLLFVVCCASYTYSNLLPSFEIPSVVNHNPLNILNEIRNELRQHYLNHLKNLTVLEKLKNLEYLTQLTQLEYLKKLSSLDYLKDLSKLSQLNKLSQLDYLSDFSRVLNIFSVKMGNLDNLSVLSKLTQLDSLSKLNALEGLKNMSNKLTNLDALGSLSKLTQLDSLSKLNALEGLKNMSNKLIKLDSLNILDALKVNLDNFQVLTTNLKRLNMNLIFDKFVFFSDYFDIYYEKIKKYWQYKNYMEIGIICYLLIPITNLFLTVLNTILILCKKPI